MVPSNILKISHYNGKAFITYSDINISKKDQDVTVILKPYYVGICSSDIKEMEGKRISRRDFGHECVAKVIVSESKHLSINDIVVLDPHIKVNRETAFSEVMYVTGKDEVIKKSLIKVNECLPELALIEPLACVIHACKQANFTNTEKIIIVGAGFFGLLFYKYLKFSGYDCDITNRSNDRIFKLRDRKYDSALILSEIDENVYSQCIFSGSELELDFIQHISKILSEGSLSLLFSPVGKNIGNRLYEIRNEEAQEEKVIGNKVIKFQGTLGATTEDFIDASEALSCTEMLSEVKELITLTQSLEQAVSHFNNRLNGKSEKIIIDVQKSINDKSIIEYRLSKSIDDVKVNSLYDELFSEKISDHVHDIIRLYRTTSEAYLWISRIDWVEKEWLEHSARNGVFLYAVKDLQGHFVGFFEACEVCDNTAKIKYIAIDKNHIGLGYGKKIILFIISTLKSKGFNQIEVETRSSDHSNAIGLYLSSGFRITSYHKV